MKIKIKTGTDARTIAEIHQRLCIAYRAVMDISYLYPTNGQSPIKAVTQDDILRIANHIQSAGFSLEAPFMAMAGSGAPLSTMDFGDNYWLRWLDSEKQRSAV